MNVPNPMKIQMVANMAKGKGNAERMMLYESNKKSPGLALVLSLILPGLGQIYNGQAGKGIGMLILYIIMCVLFFLLIPLLIAFIIWIWAMVDAYKTAKNYNMALYHAIFSA